MDISCYDKYLVPPKFCKNAILTKRGWTHPKTGELLVSKRITDDMLAYYQDVASGARLSYTEQLERDKAEQERLQRNHNRQHCKLINVNGEIFDMKNPFNLKSKVVPIEIDNDESDDE